MGRRIGEILLARHSHASAVAGDHRRALPPLVARPAPRRVRVAVRDAHHRYRGLCLAWQSIRAWFVPSEFRHGVRPHRFRTDGRSAWLPRLRLVYARRGAYFSRTVASLRQARRRPRENVARGRAGAAALGPSRRKGRLIGQVAAFALQSDLTALAASTSTCSSTDRYST